MQDGGGEGESGIHLLLSILADGEEQARQLADDDDARFRAEHDCRAAARRLQCTLGKAVSVAKAIETGAAGASGSSRGTAEDRSDSPRSADESCGGTAATEAQERPGVCKRRKGLPRWSTKFRVSDANMDATPDDGFSWRKYGQKDILGARFPRAYYRCTYRAAQGCPATKQVQRSDSDLCVFDVTYQGVHTCSQRRRRHARGGSQSPRDAGIELLAGFNDSLKVEPDAAPLHGHDHAAAASAFSFPSAPALFRAGEAQDDPPPAGSSSHFSVPLGPRGSYDDYHAGAFMRGAESSELGEVVSKATAPTAAAAAAEADRRSGYSLYPYHAELDPHLPFAPPFGGLYP